MNFGRKLFFLIFQIFIKFPKFHKISKNFKKFHKISKIFIKLQNYEIEKYFFLKKVDNYHIFLLNLNIFQKMSKDLKKFTFLSKKKKLWKTKYSITCKISGRHFEKLLPPPHVIRHTHIITPPCNTDQVITPLEDMTCCISNLSHMQN